MELTEKKRKLQEELEKLKKKSKERRKKIVSSQEYRNLDNEKKGLEKENDKLEKKREQIEEEIRHRYLEQGKYPSYKSSSYNSYYDKNIRKEVLNSIKRSLGIKNISLLKGSDIEKITEKLIDDEIDNSEELKNLWDKDRKNDHRIEEIERIQVKLLKGTDDTDDKISEIDNKLWEIKEKEEKIKKLKDKKEVAKIKRWEKKEEAEKKLKCNFNRIVEDIRIGVIKEEILNNLDDDNEEG